MIRFLKRFWHWLRMEDENGKPLLNSDQNIYIPPCIFLAALSDSSKDEVKDDTAD